MVSSDTQMCARLDSPLRQPVYTCMLSPAALLLGFLVLVVILIVGICMGVWILIRALGLDEFLNRLDGKKSRKKK